jgi:hypothetical protein
MSTSLPRSKSGCTTERNMCQKSVIQGFKQLQRSSIYVALTTHIAAIGLHAVVLAASQRHRRRQAAGWWEAPLQAAAATTATEAAGSVCMAFH